MSDAKPRVNVQIDRVVDHKEEVPNGKQYKVGTFICDGFIDGEPATGFVVRAIKEDKIKAVRAGLSCTMEVDKFMGKTKYELPRDFNAGSATYGQSSPVPTAGKAAPGPTQRPGASTLLQIEDFDALFIHAMDIVAQKLISLNVTAGVPESPCPDADCLAKLVPTYMIAAMDHGVRISKPQAPEVEKPVDMNMLLEILEKKGLTQRVESANIEEPDLINMWKGSGDSKLKFGMLVEEAIKAKEDNGDMPF